MFTTELKMNANEKNEDESEPLRNSPEQATVKFDPDPVAGYFVSNTRLDKIDGAENGEFDQSRKKNLKYLVKDTRIILLFLFLYTMQAIPYGLSSAIPLIMSSKKVSMKDQGIFSFAGWPFTLRLLYCPLIDSVYFKIFGRRKTWLFPTQLLIGILMLSCANYVNDFLENKETTSSIYAITVIFGLFTILCSILDIIQDGWLLNLLSKENLAWQSVCNSVGYTLGNFLANPLFLTLNAPDPCNKFIRPLFGLKSQPYGLLNIKNYFQVFGILFIALAVILLIFKSEYRYDKNQKPDEPKRGFHLIELFVSHKHVQAEDKHGKLTVWGTCKLIWRIVRLKPMLILMIFLFTIRLGFTAEQVIRLKIVEEGVPRERISLLGLLISPFLACVPFIMIKITDRSKPLSLLMDSFNFKLGMMLVLVLLVYFTPNFKLADDSFPLSYYVLYFVLNLINATIGFAIFFSVGSFFAQISDKAIGGTYMTFLTTVIALGATWPRTVVFFVLDATTKKVCVPDSKATRLSSMFKFAANQTTSVPSLAFAQTTRIADSTSLPSFPVDNTCSTKQLTMECLKSGGKCFITFDSFYMIAFGSAIIGLVWYFFACKVANKLQSLPKSEWKVTKTIDESSPSS